jgi:hypothetical protein
LKPVLKAQIATSGGSGGILFAHEEITMASSDVPHSPPTTEWFQRFAGRLLALAPSMKPLDAVRRAMMSYPISGAQEPEEAAQSYLASQWPSGLGGPGGEQLVRARGDGAIRSNPRAARLM